MTEIELHFYELHKRRHGPDGYRGREILALEWVMEQLAPLHPDENQIAECRARELAERRRTQRQGAQQ